MVAWLLLKKYPRIGSTVVNEDQIKCRMAEIRDTLNRMAIKGGDLRWEYLQLNQELGRIERVLSDAIVLAEFTERAQP